MLSPNFYTLIGAIESAHAFIVRYYRDIAPVAGRPAFGEGPDAVDHPATADTHLDPDPGMVSAASSRLPRIKEALLTAEGKLSISLYAAQLSGDEKLASEAWEQFRLVVTDQSFIFATVVRRLMWDQAAPSGAPEWEMMDQRLRRILKAFAEVGHGGGEDNPATNGPGILGSSNQSIKY